MITLETARAHCRIDDNFEDNLLEIYLGAAREWVEDYTGRAVFEREHVMTYDSFCDDVIEAPALVSKLTPLDSVVTILFTDTDGNETPLDPSEYRVSGDSVFPASGKTFPATLPNSKIVMTATVGDDDETSLTLVQAVLLLVSHYYNNRDAVEVGTIATTLPMGVKALCNPHRVHRV